MVYRLGSIFTNKRFGNVIATVLSIWCIANAQLAAAEHSIDHLAHDQTELCTAFKQVDGGKTLTTPFKIEPHIEPKAYFLEALITELYSHDQCGYLTRAPPSN